MLLAVISAVRLFDESFGSRFNVNAPLFSCFDVNVIIGDRRNCRPILLRKLGKGFESPTQRYTGPTESTGTGWYEPVDDEGGVGDSDGHSDGTAGCCISTGGSAKKSNVLYRHIHSHAISAFVTVIVMPSTYSIAYGLIGGMLVYVFFEGTFFSLSKVGISKPPSDTDEDKASNEVWVQEGEETAGEEPTEKRAV